MYKILNNHSTKSKTGTAQPVLKWGGRWAGEHVGNSTQAGWILSGNFLLSTEKVRGRGWSWTPAPFSAIPAKEHLVD